MVDDNYEESAVKKVEVAIDNAFKLNALAQLPRDEAIWYLLVGAEDKMFMPYARGDIQSDQNVSAIADEYLTTLFYPMKWLWQYCQSRGRIPYKHSEQTYRAVSEMLDLSIEYKAFFAAYVYWYSGFCKLSVMKDKLIARHQFLDDSRYEAYSRLIKPSTKRSLLDIHRIDAIIGNKVRVNKGRFTYKISAKKMVEIQTILEPHYRDTFILPDHWQFSRYSLKQYHDFAISLITIAVTQFRARYIAAYRGCEGLAYIDSVMVSNINEIVARISRYSGLNISIVNEIVSDLIYGQQDIKHPDPALQPLIPAGNNKIMLAPHLIMSNSMERNLSVLVNRFDDDKKIYSQLVNEKETIMRDEIRDAISSKSYRFYHGSIGGDASLPDIDLAIISDADKRCLFLELKWFIDPADIREVIQRSEELEKGVSQALKIKSVIDTNSQILLEKLGIDATYEFAFVVVSKNWIGFNNVQNAAIPIINQLHLTEKISQDKMLADTINWLKNRQYLPIEDVHYSIENVSVTIDGWALTWYGIKPLVADRFFPL